MRRRTAIAIALTALTLTALLGPAPSWLLAPIGRALVDAAAQVDATLTFDRLDGRLAWGLTLRGVRVRRGDLDVSADALGARWQFDEVLRGRVGLALDVSGVQGGVRLGELAAVAPVGTGGSSWLTVRSIRVDGGDLRLRDLPYALPDATIDALATLPAAPGAWRIRVTARTSEGAIDAIVAGRVDATTFEIDVLRADARIARHWWDGAEGGVVRGQLTWGAGGADGAFTLEEGALTAFGEPVDAVAGPIRWRGDAIDLSWRGTALGGTIDVVGSVDVAAARWRADATADVAADRATEALWRELGASALPNADGTVTARVAAEGWSEVALAADVDLDGAWLGAPLSLPGFEIAYATGAAIAFAGEGTWGVGTLTLAAEGGTTTASAENVAPWGIPIEGASARFVAEAGELRGEARVVAGTTAWRAEGDLAGDPLGWRANVRGDLLGTPVAGTLTAPRLASDAPLTGSLTATPPWAPGARATLLAAGTLARPTADLRLDAPNAIAAPLPTWLASGIDLRGGGTGGFDERGLWTDLRFGPLTIVGEGGTFSGTLRTIDAALPSGLGTLTLGGATLATHRDGASGAATLNASGPGWGLAAPLDLTLETTSGGWAIADPSGYVLASDADGWRIADLPLTLLGAPAVLTASGSDAALTWASGRVALRAEADGWHGTATTGATELTLFLGAEGATWTGAFDTAALPIAAPAGMLATSGQWAIGGVREAEAQLTLPAWNLDATARLAGDRLTLRPTWDGPAGPIAFTAEWSAGAERDAAADGLTLTGFPPSGRGTTPPLRLAEIAIPAAPWQLVGTGAEALLTWGEGEVQVGRDGATLALGTPITWGTANGRLTLDGAWRSGAAPSATLGLDLGDGATATARYGDGALTATLAGAAATWFAGLTSTLAPGGALAATGTLDGALTWIPGGDPDAALTWRTEGGDALQATWRGGRSLDVAADGLALGQRGDGTWWLRADDAELGDFLAARPNLRADGEATWTRAGAVGDLTVALAAFGARAEARARDGDLTARIDHPLGYLDATGTLGASGLTAAWQARTRAVGGIVAEAAGDLAIDDGWRASGSALVPAGTAAGIAWPPFGAAFTAGSATPFALTPTLALRGAWPEGFTLAGSGFGGALDIAFAPHATGYRLAVAHPNGAAELTGAPSAWRVDARVAVAGVTGSASLTGVEARASGAWQVTPSGAEATPWVGGALALTGAGLEARLAAADIALASLTAPLGGSNPSASGEVGVRVDANGIGWWGDLTLADRFGDVAAEARLAADVTPPLSLMAIGGGDRWTLSASRGEATLAGPRGSRLDARWGADGATLTGALLGATIDVESGPGWTDLRAVTSGAFGRLDLVRSEGGPLAGVLTSAALGAVPIALGVEGAEIGDLRVERIGGAAVATGSLTLPGGHLTADALAYALGSGFEGAAYAAWSGGGVAVDVALRGEGDLVADALVSWSGGGAADARGRLTADFAGGDLTAVAAWGDVEARAVGAFTLGPFAVEGVWSSGAAPDAAGTFTWRDGALAVALRGSGVDATLTAAGADAALVADFGDVRVDATAELGGGAIRGDAAIVRGDLEGTATFAADLATGAVEVSASGSGLDAVVAWQGGTWDGTLAWGGWRARIGSRGALVTLDDEAGAWMAELGADGTVRASTRSGIAIEATIWRPLGAIAQADAAIATPWGDGQLTLRADGGGVGGELTGDTPLGALRLDLAAANGVGGIAGTVSGEFAGGEVAWPWTWEAGVPSGEGRFRGGGALDEARWSVVGGSGGFGVQAEAAGSVAGERWRASGRIDANGAVIDALWRPEGGFTLRGRAWPTIDLLLAAGDGERVRLGGDWRAAPLTFEGDLRTQWNGVSVALLAPGRIEVGWGEQGGLQAVLPALSPPELFDEIVRRGLRFTGTGAWRGDATLAREASGWAVTADVALEAFGMPIEMRGVASTTRIDAALRIDPSAFAAQLASFGVGADPIDLRAEWSATGASLVGAAPWGVAAFLDPVGRTAGVALDVRSGGATLAGALRHGPGGWSGEVVARGTATTPALGTDPTTLEATLRGLGSLLTLDFAARGGRGDATGRGAWDGAAWLPAGWAIGTPRATLDVRLLGFDVTGLAGIDVAGRIDGTATLRDGAATGRLDSDELRVGALRAPLALEFVGDVSEGAVDAHVAFAGVDGQVRLTGEEAGFVAQLDRFALHEALTAFGASGDVTAHVSGVVRGAWRWDAPRPHDLRIATERVVLAQGGVVTEGDVAATWDGAALTIARFAFEGQGAWDVRGRVAADALDLTFRADDADFSPLLALIPNLARYGVVASGDLLLEARGSLANPDVRWRSGALEVGIAGTRSRLEGVEITLVGEAWSGSALLTGVAPLSGELALVSEGRIGPWPNSDFRVDLRAAGALDVPYVGAVTDLDARMRWVRGAPPLLDVAGALGAPFSVEGTLAPLALTGSGSGLRVGVPFLAVAEAIVDADVALRGAADGVHVTGRIDGVAAEVALAARAAASASGVGGASGRDLVHFDGVRIVAPQRVTFAESFGNAEAAVDLTLDGTAATPRLSGTIRTLRGDLRFAGRDVAVTEAVVTFDPTRGVRPTVRIVGFATFDQGRVLPGGARFVAPAGETFDVWLTLTGEASDTGAGFALGLTPTFTSDAWVEGLGDGPARPLSDLEMIALMTLGRIEGGDGVAGAVAQSAVDAAIDLFVTGELQTALAEALGIEVVELRTTAISSLVDRDPFGVSLRVGGYLSEEVFASYRVSSRGGGAFRNEVTLALAFGALSVDVAGRVDFTDATRANPGVEVSARYALAPGTALEIGFDLSNAASTARLGVSWRW